VSLLYTRTGICLEVPCHEGCSDFSGPLFLQLSRGRYDECSVLRLPYTVEEWRDDHRTARKRANRAERLGYRFDEIRREDHSQDIYEINTSLDTRQGRPMTDQYTTPVEFGPLAEYPCPRHRVSTYGVLHDDTLVAYLWLYRAGDLALVSSILGHGDHLENDVMFLLMQGTITCEVEDGGFLVYNRHDSGTDGLRYYKERCGFTPTDVEWLA
jgi:hypothetical protein